MAQQVIITLTDDMDGTEGDDIEPVHFALGNHAFKADLSAKNRLRLREALAPFIEHAQPADARYRRAITPVNGSSTRGRITHVRAPRDRASRDRAARIRTWAKDQPGIQVGEKGRIPHDVEVAYDAAHTAVI